MSKTDFFTGKNGNYALTHILILESIGDRTRKTFIHKHYESDVITEIARITNDKNYCIHKIMIMNEEGDVRELEVDFINGKLRLKLIGEA